MMAILHLILLYGFLLGQYSNNPVLPGSNLTQNSSDVPLNERSYFTGSSLFNAIPPENQVSGANSVPAPSLKNHINDYTAYPRTADLLFFNLISDYLIYSRNIDPGFPKTVITFPFHYFW